MPSNQQTLNQFLTLTDRFTAVVDAAPSGSWGNASPCAGWTATDVLDHVVDSQRDFFARHSLGLGERPTGKPAQVWAAHAAATRRVLGDGEVLGTEFDSFFGPSTVGATLAMFFCLDLVIHRWDLARATGTETTFSEAELAAAEACLNKLGDNIYAHGACDPAVEVPADATRTDRLIARTGRDPR